MKRKYDAIDDGKRERNNIRCYSDPLVAKAYNAAITGFKGKVRKLPKGYPPGVEPKSYFTHAYEVSFILANYLYPPKVVAAGLLHDHAEDLRNWSIARISKGFGPEIAALVQVVTQPSRGDWQTRKDAYFNQVEAGPANWPEGVEYATAIAAADKIANMRASVRLMRDGIPLDAYLHGTWGMHIAVWARLATLLPGRVHPLMIEEFNDQLARITSMSKRFGEKGG